MEKCELRDVIFSFAMALFLHRILSVFQAAIRPDVGFSICRFEYLGGKGVGSCTFFDLYYTAM